MKISKKSYYGLRAVLALAQADKSLSIHALAETEHLPEGYLEKILQSLRKGGVVEAKKGTTGGYSLARDKERINVWEILRILDGPMKPFMPPIKGELPASNAKRVATAGWPCPPQSHCQTSEVWRRLEHEIETSLSQVTLGSLIPEHPHH